jgi:hypothetical protein
VSDSDVNIDDGWTKIDDLRNLEQLLGKTGLIYMKESFVTLCIGFITKNIAEIGNCLTFTEICRIEVQ